MATQTIKVTKRTFTMTHKPKYNRNGTVKPQKKRKVVRRKRRKKK